MYKILSDTNELLGYVEKPNYIKYNKTHDFVPAVPVEAIGINFKGVVYNLLGHHDIEGADTCYASMVTEAEFNAMKESNDQQITDLQMTIIDMYEMSMANMGLTE